jgi:hypothetical protein
MTDTETVFSEMEILVSFAVPEKPEGVDQEVYEWRVMQVTLDSIIHNVVSKFLHETGFDKKTIAACFLSTLTDCLTQEAVFLGISKEDLLHGVEMMFDDQIMGQSSDHEAGNA